jgi:hypothetical protein
MSKTIVIDIWSVVPDLSRVASKLVGTPVPGLVRYVMNEQDGGSTVFFVAGQAHDPLMRQRMENFLESIGIRAVFVTHGVPDGFDVFISAKAFKFNGSFPP